MNRLRLSVGLILMSWSLAAGAEPDATGRETGSGERSRRAEPPPRRAVNAADATAGMLLLRGADDESTWLAPQVSNVVEMRVTGMLARAHLEQVFENPSDEVVEAIYVFPLPETAAVDGLRLDIGERRIVGRIQERDTARKTFEQAKRVGKKASLVEQERPNLFTTSVANIGPGEMVHVTLSYQQDVNHDSGQFSLVFPSTLTPRYLPGEQRVAGAISLDRSSVRAALPADAERITPPFTIDDGPSLEINVEIDAGFPLASVVSPSHQIDVAPSSAAGPVAVHLSRGSELADRDFRLQWSPVADRAPRVAVFEEEFQGERFALVLALPPQPARADERRLPRRTTFVIDTSGSMAGTSIEQAKRALESGLERLHAEDQFNVIEFNSEARSLFEEPRQATPEHVARAKTWVRELVADGGTEMLPALTLALGGASARDRVGQVLFITDGSVGNEDELLGFIRRELGEQRLFTVGIGSAPNQYFMRGAARFGRGTFTYVADTNEVGHQMNDLWRKLEAPVVSGLELGFSPGVRAEVWPHRLPDLYLGEPLVILVKLDAGADALTVLGKQLGQPFAQRLELNRAQRPAGLARPRERGLHRLWARRKIEALMDQVIEGVPEAQIQPQVTSLALKHHVMSQYTSLVAIDDRRTVEAPGQSVRVANALPAGNAMFGNLPSTATPGPTCLLLGLFSFVGAWAVRRGSGS